MCHESEILYLVRLLYIGSLFKCTYLLTERSISNDRDLFAESRLEISVRITDHVHHATTVRQSYVNFNNLISITTQHSRVSVKRSQSSLKLLSFDSQSCLQIATDIYDLIVDNSLDNVDGIVAVFHW